MDNIFERLMYTLSAVVILLAAYYYYIDAKPSVSPSSSNKSDINYKHTESSDDVSTDSEQENKPEKVQVYSEYYENPDYRRSDVPLDDYVPTDEDIEEYRKYKEGL